MPSYRPTEAMSQQTQALLARHKTNTAVLERAVALLHWAETNEMIRALMNELDSADPRAVLERAVRELYAREIEDERDVFDNLADLAARVAALEAARDTA